MIYNILKLVHITAVILFLGNIFTGLFWMHIAVKTRDLKIIFHSIKGLIRSDQLFTVPGVIIITAGGFAAAVFGGTPILRTGWIFWSLILFIISGVIFAWKLVPLQKRIRKMTEYSDAELPFNWIQFKKTYLWWEIWGLVAFLTPIAALIMMVLKFPQ